RKVVNCLTLQSPPQRSQQSTIRRLVRPEGDYAAAGSTFHCVLQTAARENRMLDAPALAMNRSRRLRAPAGGKSLRCATAFRSRHLHSMDTYETFRLQKSDIQDVTWCVPDRVRNALPFQQLDPLRALALRC